MFFQSKKSNILDQRYNIAFFSAIFAFLSAIVYFPEFYTFFVYYIVFAIALDQFMRVIKPAPLTEDILNRHKMTPEQIVTYVKSKKIYRLVAASISVIIGLIAQIFGAKFGLFFVLTYGGIWSLYPFIRMIFLNIPAPKFIRTLTDQEWQTQNKLFQDSLNNRNYDPLRPGTLGYDVNKMHNMMNSVNSHLKNLR